jgi:hypothetical protein
MSGDVCLDKCWSAVFCQLWFHSDLTWRFVMNRTKLWQTLNTVSKTLHRFQCLWKCWVNFKEMRFFKNVPPLHTVIFPLCSSSIQNITCNSSLISFTFRGGLSATFVVGNEDVILSYLWLSNCLQLLRHFLQVSNIPNILIAATQIVFLGRCVSKQ